MEGVGARRIVVTTFLLATAMLSVSTVTLADAATSASSVTVPYCVEGGVSIVNGPFAGGATQEEAHMLKITNTGSSACVVNGYVTIRALDAANRALPFTFSHRATGGYPMTTKPPRAFTLKRHQSSYVFFAQIACVEGYRDLARRVTIALPHASGSGKTVALSTPLAFCKGSNAAIENTIALSPIEPSVKATEF